MTLSAGTRLGPYEIMSPLGAGGMGEVYRARDKKLDREVAIKVLPQSVAADPDSLARFEREAKAVAALSHQNILAIHDFGTQEGVAYAVMELLEGETLRGKLDAGSIPQKQAVDYALQVAKGLSAAHEKGIVHRDLKPENLFVSRDGHLKILDFGLAKRVEAVAQGQETSAPTGSGHTEPGMVMGTMGYMSPEQVKGFPVDHRSDIFSFGTILYELLSGRKAFKRDTNAETMAAILMREPPEFSESGRNISPSLERIVKHCLEKDRESRFQTARDIAFSLSEQFEPTATSGPRESAPPIGSAGFWVAVLPFKCGTADADVLALADGLSEEIVTGLSRFRYLSVVASASAARLKGEAGDERALGAKLGARYVLEGSIRRGGSDLRVSAQLVDARTGAQLWSETFRRDLQASSLFAVQDDVAGRIVATVADSYGVLVHSIRAATRQRDDVDLTPGEWQFQYFAYREQITPSSHAELKSRLERVVERNDRQSDVWACLAQIYVDEYAFGFQSDATSLDRALTAARRAVELDRANQFALVALAQVHFFRQDLAAFGPAAERAMALNPLNTDAVGILGLQIVHTGEFERGTAIVRRAMELNANHAGWMHFAPLWEHFHKGEYEEALECANRVDVPGLFWPFLVVASACGHLGRRAEAESAVRDLLALDPDFAAHARSNVGTWHFASGLMEPILEGLRKAGLSIPGARTAALHEPGPARSSTTDSGAARADEGFWIAVLPFKYGGADASLTALAEGLTEEIVTGLSRFSYLKVISRSATAGVRSGNELGARYVMEGSLRQAGTRLRIAVQLVDAVSGAHLWAENYERPFLPESVFELQDELVPRIVSTVADTHGVLPRSMSEIVRSRAPEQLSPYEAVLRSFGYFERATIEELAAARSGLESAVRKAPAYAEAWAMLSILCTHEYGQAFDLQPDSLTTGSAAARRAVEAAPSSHLAWFSLAQALFFQKEFQSFRNAAERALALNPMDGDSIATLGGMLTCAGDLERGLALTGRAKQLNPHHPGWYWWVDFCNAYRQGDYRGALNFALKMNLPGHWFMHAAMSAAYGQLGESAAASKAIQNLLEMRPDFAATVRMNIEKWWEPDFVEHLMDGWRKAGLETAPAPASASRDDSGAARAEDGFWVAVLPFKYAGGAELKALSDGLSEEVVTGLSRFSYLRVIARGSTARFSSESGDIRAIGKDLGARYVMEGSIRQAGTRLRLAVQLVDAVSGAHLWAENYERPFSPEAVFELQDDLGPRIVSTCADRFGVLARSISDAVRGRESAQLGPYEALMRGFGYHQRLTPAEHAEAREALEGAVDRSPSNADCWAMLSWIYSHEHAHGFNVRPGSLDRALAAARRAVDLAPSNPLAQQALAVVLFFRKETEACRSAAERAIALNPLDTSNEAIFLIGFMGDWVRSCALIRRAMELNPHHPRWYGTVLAFNEYRLANYRAAVDEVLKANAPDVFWTPMLLAAALGQLGEVTAARNALRDLLAQKKDFAHVAGELMSKWFDPGLTGSLVDGLRKAGLEIPDDPAKPGASPAITGSGAARADEGFWVAVLPFKYAGGAELKALSDGLFEEVVTGLSRFSYLRVIARGSTAGLSSESGDIRAIGKDLGARYVMEGSIRQAGTRLRLAVQLVDAVSGAHLWAENYERSFNPEAVFELQDDLVPRIVSIVAGMNGILPRSMSEVVRNRAPEQLSPYEAVLRSFGYLERVTPEELAVARSALELAVAKAPDYADAWAMLALLCLQDYGQGFDLQPDSLARGAAAARRAVEAAPAGPLASFSLAQALYFQKEFETFRNVAERAAALNPMDGNSIAFLGELLTYAGESERGLALAGRAKQLNPNHPGWYWYADFYDAYRRGDDDGALRFALKINLPGHWPSHAAIAAACGQLGQMDAAGKALKGLLELRPDFATTARSDFEKWFEPGYVERAIDGLRKAGLEMAGESAAAAREGVAIAVLPFSDLSAAKDQEYLCEGMAEEIMNALVGIEGIRVASRTSTFQARRRTDLPGIGKLLSVGHILEGSVRTSGSQLRVTAQLTEVASGYQIWSERFDREAADIFAVQDEIAAGVVEAVKARLAPGEHAVPARPQPANLEAYRSYLKGRHLRGKEHVDGAIRAFEEAVRLDPSHAPSWTGLAEATVLASVFGVIPASEACATARKALATATRLQGESAEGLHVEAFVAWIERRWAAMETAWRRAIELQPTHVLALASFGIVLCTRQRLDEALPFLERARQADPLASFPYALTGKGLLNCGRAPEALRYLEDALSFEKEDVTALESAGMAMVALGRLEEGIAALEHVVEVTHRGAQFLGTLGWALATAGRKGEARTILEELRARPVPAPAVVSEAWLLGALGQVDAAFEVVARAEDEYLAYLYFTGHPGFDPLRADPRFGALLERLGLPREQG